MELSGKVVKKTFAGGSKSERPGIFLVSDQGEYLLRRKGANPFRDPDLENLVGHEVRCEGILHGYTFIATAFEITDCPGA
jgi:hypothetical protein